MTVVVEPVKSLHGADFEQAAYFRAELQTERRLLLSTLEKRRAIIERPKDAAGAPISLTKVDVQLRHIDWLLAKLDRRFGPDDGAALD